MRMREEYLSKTEVLYVACRLEANNETNRHYPLSQIIQKAVDLVIGVNIYVDTHNKLVTERRKQEDTNNGV